MHLMQHSTSSAWTNVGAKSQTGGESFLLTCKLWNMIGPEIKNVWNQKSEMSEARNQKCLKPEIKNVWNFCFICTFRLYSCSWQSVQIEDLLCRSRKFRNPGQLPRKGKTPRNTWRNNQLLVWTMDNGQWPIATKRENPSQYFTQQSIIKLFWVLNRPGPQSSTSRTFSASHSCRSESSN